MSATLVTYTISFGSLGATLPPRKKMSQITIPITITAPTAIPAIVKIFFLVIKSVLSSAQNTQRGLSDGSIIQVRQKINNLRNSYKRKRFAKIALLTARKIGGTMVAI